MYDSETTISFLLLSELYLKYYSIADQSSLKRSKWGVSKLKSDTGNYMHCTFIIILKQYLKK